MRLQRFDNFLSRGSAALQVPCRAVGIHPSSMVDLVDVNGARLTVGGIVPIDGSAEIRAVRNPFTGDQVIGAGGANQTDLEQLGEALVLQCYEDCDSLSAPGPRVPYYRDHLIPSAALGATEALAYLVFRIPFHGRAVGAISFRRTTNAADLSVYIVGRAYGYRDSPLVLGTDFKDDGAVWTQAPTETWFDGGGAAAVVNPIDATKFKWRTIYVGGLGDAAEAFDELVVYAFGAAGGDALVTAEVYGERHR